MIVVKKCNKCGKNYDTEFMSDESCSCSASKTVGTGKRQYKSKEYKWDNVPINSLPAISNKREKEAEAILALFSNK